MFRMHDAAPMPGTTDDLLRRLAFAEAVTRATPDCLYIFDVVSNEFRYQNVTIQDFLGYDDAALADVRGDFYQHVGHPDELEDALRALKHQRALKQGEYTDRNYRLRGGDGV